MNTIDGLRIMNIQPYKKNLMNTYFEKKHSIFVKNIIFYGISILLLIFIMNENTVLAQSDQFYLERGEELYFEAMDLFLNSVLKNNESLKTLDEACSYFNKIEEPQTKYYCLARTTYLMGVIEKDIKNHESAKEQFIYSKELITFALDGGDFSDGLRLLADIEGQIIAYKDLYYKTKFGPPIKNNINKSLKLDPYNEKAYFSLAMFYRDAPMIAGGDLKKSKMVLRDIINITGNDTIDMFSLYLWIDSGWVNSNYNREKTSEYISMLDIFSNRTDIDFMAKRIEKKYSGN